MTTAIRRALGRLRVKTGPNGQLLGHQPQPTAPGPEVDLGATKPIARYRTLKRNLAECRWIEGLILNPIRFIT
jgi:hypothetical protein